MKKFLILLSFVFVGYSANAATITLNKGLSAGFNVLSSSDTILTSGTTLFVGTFANGVAPATPVNGNYASILNSFNVFGSTAVLNPITGSVTATPTTPNDATFETYQIYIIVANSSTLSTATQIGIFTNTAATFFPSDVIGTTTANFNVTTQGGNLISVVAGAGSIIDNTSGVDSLKLIAVPEPSVALLGALGGLALLRRRRN